MKSFKELLESRSSTIVMAFGRMNPCTAGHELLVRAVTKLATQKKADHVIYLSRSQDSKKNPLNVDQKVYYARQSFKGVNIVGASDQIRTFIEAAKSLSGKYKTLIMVAGSDRVLEYKQLLDKYNGKDFSFDTILVVSAGERDPDADGASGMSATKMRQAASENNFNKFKLGVPSGMSVTVAKKMFDDVRAGMRISEGVDDVREDYINERIFNVGDVVIHNSVEMAITHRGPNYVVLEGNVKAWLKDIQQTKKVNEAIMVKQQEKLKAARIIGMALGYEDAESKTDPSMIINSALRSIKGKALNKEAKQILQRMLELAKKMEISYDEKIMPLKEEQEISELSSTTVKSYAKKAMMDTLTGKKDRNQGMIRAYSRQATTNKPLSGEEKSEHNLMHEPQESGYKRIRKIHVKMHEEIEEEISDKDIEDMINDFSEDDILEHGYDEDELVVLDENDEIIDISGDDSQTLNEVLSKIERIRAKARMRRTQTKRERAEKIAIKRKSTAPVLAKRARRLAVKALEKKIARKPLNTLSVPEKERVEARIAKMKPALDRLALKMLPRVRDIESSRLHKGAKE